MEKPIPEVKITPILSDKPQLAGSSSGYTAEDDSYTTDNSTNSPHYNIIVERLLLRRDKWRIYGNHKVFFNGKIIIGPVRSWWWLLEILTIIVFSTFIYEHQKYYVVLLVVGIVLFAVTLISSFFTLCMDPGIIKKPNFEDALCQARKVVEVMKTGVGQPVKIKTINGRSVRFSYCFLCHIFRSPDSGHCHVCECCHEKWDHHCPVYGGCVAKGNYYAFNTMTASMSLFFPFMLIASAFAAVETYNKMPSENRSFIESSLVLDEIIIGIILAILLPPLLIMLPCEKDHTKEQPDNANVYHYDRSGKVMDYPQQQLLPISLFNYNPKTTNYYNSPTSRLTFTTYNIPTRMDTSNFNGDYI